MSAASRLSSTIRTRKWHAGRRLVWRSRRARRRFHHDRQPDDELAALADTGTADFQRAAVHLRQRLRERQADAEPGRRPLQRGVDLREHLEDPSELIGGDADAGVPHPYDSALIAFRAFSALRGEPDAPAAVGELAGVVQEVSDDLREPCRVGVDEHRHRPEA